LRRGPRDALSVTVELALEAEVITQGGAWVDVLAVDPNGRRAEEALALGVLRSLNRRSWISASTSSSASSSRSSGSSAS
jgi:hypothetical protein